MQITWNQISHLFHSSPYIQPSSVQFSCSVVSDSVQSHGMQHTRPPCPSPTPRIYPNSCPLSWWCHPTISSSRPLFLLPSIFPGIRVFSNESVLRITWPKYWSFSFNISPSNEYSGLISFRMDWLDLLVVKGPLKSLLQHHSSKASILRHSAFFTVQLSHPYRTTGKTTALTEYSVSLVCVCMYIHMCAQLCLTFLQPHVLKPARLLCPWILQGRTLAWVATSSSRGSFRPTDLINGATWEAHSILLEVCN